MYEIALAIAKYFIIFLFAIFSCISFLTQKSIVQAKEQITLRLQGVLIIAVHFFSFFCIFLNAAAGNAGDIGKTSVAILYALQLLYLIFIIYVLPHIVRLSKAINNCMCMLITIGFVIQTRLSFATGRKHFIFITVSTVIYIIAALLCKKVSFLYKLTWLYYIMGLCLLLIVFIFAKLSYGAKISIDLGFVSVQPFEFTKILFVFFTAAAFNKANDFKHVLITAICAASYILILVVCTELGTALILAVAYVMMLFVATKKILYLVICIVAFAAACVVAYLLFSHVRVRVDVWLNPWSDIDNRGYQITQSLFAIGTGGWLGLGLYAGMPTYVPMVTNDFVFSAIAEELGSVFAVFLILLCLCFTLMIFRVALKVSKPFYKLLAFGLGAVYAFQVFLEIGGAIKFIPSTGINLPFISSGGSSLVASMVLVAVIQGLYVISEANENRISEISDDEISLDTDDHNDIQDRIILVDPEDICDEDDGKRTE